MKNNSQLFKKRVKQSFARGEMEVLEVDESGGCVSDIGDDEGDNVGIKGGGEWVGMRRTEFTRKILLVKKKGNLTGQNLQFPCEDRLQEHSTWYHECCEMLSKGKSCLFTQTTTSQAETDTRSPQGFYGCLEGAPPTWQLHEIIFDCILFVIVPAIQTHQIE